MYNYMNTYENQKLRQLIQEFIHKYILTFEKITQFDLCEVWSYSTEWHWDYKLGWYWNTL